MDKNINMFIRSFKNELTEPERKELAALLENEDNAAKYDYYRKIWDRAITEGKSVNPDSGKTWESLSSAIRADRSRRRRTFGISLSAAAISGVAAVMAYLFVFRSALPDEINEEMLTDAASTEWTVPLSDKIIIRTASDHYYSIASKQAEISVLENGGISINSVLIDNMPEQGLNRVRIPRGKRVNLNLSDGTRICLNSNSDITFPSGFCSQERMVHLAGEAYFSVARDENRPFTVYSDRMDVSVLGTEFNFDVSDDSAVVTLVSGKVQVETDLSGTCVLAPNQQVAFENGRLEEVRNVDVESVICWTSHKIICRDQRICEVFGKLSRYFDRDFIFNGTFDDIEISGKLDLTEGLDSVLESIAFVAPVAFSESKEGIIVSRKQ